MCGDAAAEASGGAPMAHSSCSPPFGAPQSRPEPARGRVRSRSARVALSALYMCSIRVHRRRRCVRWRGCRGEWWRARGGPRSLWCVCCAAEPP